MFPTNLLQYLEPFIIDDQSLSALARTCKSNFRLIYFRLYRCFLSQESVPKARWACLGSLDKSLYPSDAFLTSQFAKTVLYISAHYQLGRCSSHNETAFHRMDNVAHSISMDEYMINVAFSSSIIPHFADPTDCARIIRTWGGIAAMEDHKWQQLYQLVRSGSWSSIQSEKWQTFIQNACAAPVENIDGRKQFARERLFFLALAAIDPFYSGGIRVPAGSREILHYILEIFSDNRETLFRRYYEGDEEDEEEEDDEDCLAHDIAWFFIDNFGIRTNPLTQAISRIFSAEFTEERAILASIIYPALPHFKHTRDYPDAMQDRVTKCSEIINNWSNE